MKIGYERTGGFAGMRIAAQIDLDDLPDDQVKVLRELLDEAEFDDLPAKILPSRPGSDQFNYRVTVGEKTVETTESAAPEKLRALLSELQHLARSRQFKQ